MHFIIIYQTLHVVDVTLWLSKIAKKKIFKRNVDEETKAF